MAQEADIDETKWRIPEATGVAPDDLINRPLVGERGAAAAASTLEMDNEEMDDPSVAIYDLDSVGIRMVGTRGSCEANEKSAGAARGREGSSGGEWKVESGMPNPKRAKTQARGLGTSKLPSSFGGKNGPSAMMGSRGGRSIGGPQVGSSSSSKPGGALATVGRERRRTGPTSSTVHTRKGDTDPSRSPIRPRIRGESKKGSSELGLVLAQDVKDMVGDHNTVIASNGNAHGSSRATSSERGRRKNSATDTALGELKDTSLSPDSRPNEEGRRKESSRGLTGERYTPEVAQKNVLKAKRERKEENDAQQRRQQRKAADTKRMLEESKRKMVENNERKEKQRRLQAEEKQRQQEETKKIYTATNHIPKPKAQGDQKPPFRPPSKGPYISGNKPIMVRSSPSSTQRPPQVRRSKSSANNFTRGRRKKVTRRQVDVPSGAQQEAEAEGNGNNNNESPIQSATGRAWVDRSRSPIITRERSRDPSLQERQRVMLPSEGFLGENVEVAAQEMGNENIAPPLRVGGVGAPRGAAGLFSMPRKWEVIDSVKRELAQIPRLRRDTFNRISDHRDRRLWTYDEIEHKLDRSDRMRESAAKRFRRATKNLVTCIDDEVDNDNLKIEAQGNGGNVTPPMHAQNNLLFEHSQSSSYYTRATSADGRSGTGASRGPSRERWNVFTDQALENESENDYFVDDGQQPQMMYVNDGQQPQMMYVNDGQQQQQRQQQQQQQQQQQHQQQQQQQKKKQKQKPKQKQQQQQQQQQQQLQQQQQQQQQTTSDNMEQFFPRRSIITASGVLLNHRVHEDNYNTNTNDNSTDGGIPPGMKARQHPMPRKRKSRPRKKLVAEEQLQGQSARNTGQRTHTLGSANERRGECADQINLDT